MGDDALASAPTLKRLVARCTRTQTWALLDVLIEQLSANLVRAPMGLALDIDA